MERNELHSLENTASVPLYLQLEQRLREDIQNGIFSPGSKLPTENELSETYHVSRVTVRKALQLLEDGNFIHRKVGKGTYVAEQKLQRSFTENVRSFSLMCEEIGRKASAKMIRMEIMSPDENQQHAMKLSADQQILVIERIRYADDEPVMIERDIFSEEFRFLFAEDLENNSLYGIIHDKKKIVFSHADRTIDIVFSSAAEAKLLGLKTGYPLLRISSITTNDTGSVTTISEQLYIGDKFKLHV